MWNVNSGLQVRFWTDRWLTDGPPLASAAHDLPHVAQDLTVAELILNGDWNLPFIREFLPEEVVVQLRLHPVPMGNTPDIPFWRYSDLVNFTLKTAYELTREGEDPEQSYPVWKKAWRFQGPQRKKTFLWLALHGRLLTNKDRDRLHLTQSDHCPVCGGGPKSIVHIIRDFPYARGVWSFLLRDEPDSDFFEPDSRRWFLYYLSGRGKVLDASLFGIRYWNCGKT
ncbi:unnamed protein product [Linum trigynum]|uniref:Reverse transcriptase zinc-binding domain-containing protein n=1 Tax=Linum trigynum TaxID=586398 RepID=A0AAV2GPR6_9ROSI